MRSTAELVTNLFGSAVIARKVVYAPLGVRYPERFQAHADRPDDEPINLLFINSWCQVPENFYVRGGLDVLEAFAVLRERYPQLRLTMRTALPALDDHYLRIIEGGWVRVVNRFLTDEEMAELHAGSDVFLLPAARVHIVSLLQAMSYCLAVVGSTLGDGRVPGGRVERAGGARAARHASWADPEGGLLRENYEVMYTPDPVVVAASWTRCRGCRGPRAAPPVGPHRPRRRARPAQPGRVEPRAEVGPRPRPRVAVEQAVVSVTTGEVRAPQEEVCAVGRG
jgi:hypothetical protein